MVSTSLTSNSSVSSSRVASPTRIGPTEQIKQTQDAIADEFGVAARYSAADMTKPDAIAGMIAITLEAFSRLDVLDLARPARVK